MLNVPEDMVLSPVAVPELAFATKLNVPFMLFGVTAVTTIFPEPPFPVLENVVQLFEPSE
jgi:hypothetical protein